MNKFFKLSQIISFILIILFIVGGSCNDTSNNPSNLKIILSDNHTTILVNTQRIFFAKAEGLKNSAVNWNITVQIGNATIEPLDNNNALFTAPSTPGIVKIKVSSVENPSITAIIEINVIEQLETEVIFNNANVYTVQNKPTNPTVFTIDRPRTITFVRNYHYNNNGVLPGTISFKHTDGTIYGPWQCVGGVGQGSVENAFWICYPFIQIKAGTYTVIDSDPDTWSHNIESNNCGFTRIDAIK